MIEHNTPISYAKYLAGYISDPSTVRARVADEYGRAPSVDIIRKIREELTKIKRVEGFSLCESRYTPLFKCGHEESADNIVTDMNGYDRCRACEEAKYEAMQRREAVRQARVRAQMAKERAEREAKRIQIKPVLDRLIKKPASDRPRVGTELINQVAAFFKLTFDDIVGKDRSRLFIDARCVVALIMRERGLSYPQIGRFMKRDHSTIINLVEKADERIARNPLMLKALEALR